LDPFVQNRERVGGEGSHALLCGWVDSLTIERQTARTNYSTVTSFQNATRPLIFAVASFGLGIVPGSLPRRSTIYY
jgi:hypothetical protein